MTDLFQKEQAKSLLELLRSAHAVQYTGLDDEMIDDFDSWVSSLSDNDVSDIVIGVFRRGI